MQYTGYLHWLLVAMTTFTLLACTSGRLGDILDRHNKRSVARNRHRTFRSVGNWSEFTPNPPSADEVDCQIEVEVRQIVGGRCVRLGGVHSPAVCQSGIHLDFWSQDCQHILAGREDPAGAARGGATAHRDGD